MLKYFLPLLIIITAFSFTKAYADVEQDRLVKEIADDLRCPICQGLSVGDSQTEISENMKSKIRDLLNEGKDREEVMQFFEDRYGEWIRRVPKPGGLNETLWILPGGMIFFGFCFLLFFLIRRNNKPSTVDNYLSDNFKHGDPEIDEEIRKAERLV